VDVRYEFQQQRTVKCLDEQLLACTTAGRLELTSSPSLLSEESPSAALPSSPAEASLFALHSDQWSRAQGENE
jgi:hypothetical protein